MDNTTTNTGKQTDREILENTQKVTYEIQQTVENLIIGLSFMALVVLGAVISIIIKVL